MEENWKTNIGHNLALGIALLSIIISLVDFYHAPIFIRETASIRAQVLGQDIVNLVISAPATLYALYLSKKGSYKARTALIGILAYYAYTFLSYVILFKLNDGFLLYTAAFGVSLYGTLLMIAGLDIERISVTHTPSIRKNLPIVLGVILLVVVVLWTPDLVHFYTTGLYPENIIADNVHTLAIHFQDLSIVGPLTMLTIWLVRSDNKIGYILAPVLLVKAVSIGLAVLGMIIVMQVSGVPAAIGQVMIFVVATLVLGGYTYRFYSGIEMGVNV